MKLSLEDKKEIVRLYFEERLGCKIIAKKYNVYHATIQTIIRGYKVHGDSYLIHPPKNHKYSPEFKESIIKQVYEGKTKMSLAAEYGLPGAGTITVWMHKYEKSGYNGLITKKRGKLKMDNKKIVKKEVNLSSPLTDKERIEFEELKEKYRDVQMENEFLKKLEALVRERLKRERKK